MNKLQLELRLLGFNTHLTRAGILILSHLSSTQVELVLKMTGGQAREVEPGKWPFKESEK